MTLADADDGADEPAPLLATTVKVYAVPFVRPVTVQLVVAVVHVTPSGLEVTVYDVGLPVEADQETSALDGCVERAVTPVGTPGAGAATVTLLSAVGRRTSLVVPVLLTPTW